MRLAQAAHPGPTVAVTALTMLYAIGVGHSPARVALLTAAILTGQLSIGWSNDVLDAARDQAVRRLDKPIATGSLPRRIVLVALAMTLAICTITSLACGWRAGLTHLVLGVGGGWSYNLGLKRTRASWLPYVLAFGSLPAVVTLALPTPMLPSAWVMGATALLGVGAHLVNVLPDLEQDAVTGVRGLPQRLGRPRVQVIAPIVLTGATVLLMLGAGPPTYLTWMALAVVLALAATSIRGQGRTPLHGAMAIALVDVVLLIATA